MHPLSPPGIFSPPGMFSEIWPIWDIGGACMMNSDISQNISGSHSLWSNLIWFLLFVASIKTDITLIENFVSNHFFFQKQSCPGDSQNNISCFPRTFFSNLKTYWFQLSEHEHCLFLCPFCPRMHVFCSKSTHVESDALNCNNRILAPKNLTEPKNQRFGLFLFLLTIPRGLRPRGPPLHIQGHSSPDGLGCNYLFSGRSNRS